VRVVELEEGAAEGATAEVLGTVAAGGATGGRRGRSEREPRRRIISAETRQRGESDKEGSRRGAFLSLDVEGDGPTNDPLDGKEKDRDSRLNRGSGSVSMASSRSFWPPLSMILISSEHVPRLLWFHASLSSHVLTSLPSVKSIESSRILSCSILRLCRS
jgi:hypothetical protein